jgi:LSD1 subclass zinc finger protein
MMCPQCNAPLAPPRFARSVVCAYCGTTVQLGEASVSAETFRKALRIWNSPASYQISSWISIGDSHWALHKCIANGNISDVYTGQRARWPTELAIIKLLRDHQDTALFDKEWEVLQLLQGSDAPGSDTFTTLLPQPIVRGNISAGLHVGQRLTRYGERTRKGFLQEPRSGSGDGSWKYSHSYTILEWFTEQSCLRISSFRRMNMGCGSWDTVQPVLWAPGCGQSHLMANLFIQGRHDL